jgi:hypothetical protein
MRTRARGMWRTAVEIFFIFCMAGGIAGAALLPVDTTNTVSVYASSDAGSVSGSTLSSGTIWAEADDATDNPVVITSAYAGVNGSVPPTNPPANANYPLAQAIAETSSTNGGGNDGSSSSFLYDFQLNGPPGASIPIKVEAQLYAIAVEAIGYNPADGPGGDTLSLLYIIDATQYQAGEDPTPLLVSASAEIGGIDTANPQINSTIYANPGDLISVYGEVISNLDGASASSAYVDPYFEVDPSYPSASEYSITASPGVVNAAPVPEPSPSTLFALTLLAGLLPKWWAKFPRVLKMQ